MVSFLVAATGTKEADGLIEDFCTAEDFTDIHSSKKTAPERLLARALTRKLLAQSTGTHDWNFCYDPQGKPYAFSSGIITAPFLSWSHSKKLVAAGISTAFPIGIDIECWRPRSYNEIADFCFGPEECANVMELGQSAFYKIWTIREAKAKATGKGILFYMDGSDQSFQSPEIEENSWNVNYIACLDYSLAVVECLRNTR